MANTANSLDFGSATAESGVPEMLSSFVSGLKYPFQVNVTNQCKIPLVFPWVHLKEIKPGETVLLTIKNEPEINDLFNAGITIGQLNKIPQVITVALPGKAAAAAPADKGAEA